MKGRRRFTRDEAAAIRRLLRQKVVAGRDVQKRLRNEIREIGFYISDWSSESAGFTATDFDALVSSGQIEVQGGPDRPTTVDLSILNEPDDEEESQPGGRGLRSTAEGD